MDRDELQQKVDKSIDTSNWHILHDMCKKQLQEIVEELATLTKLQGLQKQFLKIVDDGKKERKSLDALPEIVVDFHKMREDIQRLDKLQGFYNGLNSVEEQIVALPAIEFDVDIDFSNIHENIQKLDKFQKLRETLGFIDGQIKALEVIEFDVDIEEAQKEWTATLADLKICPTCKQSTANIEEHCRL